MFIRFRCCEYANPVKQLWFKNIKRTTTDNILRHIIPIDYEKGLIMILIPTVCYVILGTVTIVLVKSFDQGLT